MSVSIDVVGELSRKTSLGFDDQIDEALGGVFWLNTDREDGERMLADPLQARDCDADVVAASDTSDQARLVGKSQLRCRNRDTQASVLAVRAIGADIASGASDERRSATVHSWGREREVDPACESSYAVESPHSGPRSL